MRPECSHNAIANAVPILVPSYARWQEGIVIFDIFRIDPDTIVHYFNRQRVLFAVMCRQHDAAVTVGD